jgi:hypothetical protein
LVRRSAKWSWQFLLQGRDDPRAGAQEGAGEAQASLQVIAMELIDERIAELEAEVIRKVLDNSHKRLEVVRQGSL